LRSFFGSSYYALGFSFNHGEFQAKGPKNGDRSKLELNSFSVQAAPVDSIDWWLAQAGKKQLLVDLRGAGTKGAFAEWLRSPHGMRDIGGVFFPDAGDYLSPSVLGKDFDGVFFVDTTTRARPNSPAKSVAQ